MLFGSGLVLGYGAGVVLGANDEPLAAGMPYWLPATGPFVAAVLVPAALYRPLVCGGGVGKTTLDGEPAALAKPGAPLPYPNGGPTGEATPAGLLVPAKLFGVRLFGVRLFGVGAALGT